MKINVRIERLILDGLPVATLQGPQVARGVEKELARLLAVNGLSDELRGGIAVPSVHAGAVRLGKETQPARLGQSIARAVHEGIGNCGAGILPAEDRVRSIAAWKAAPQEGTRPVHLPEPGGSPR
ncbi:MAG: hypothetical protein ACRD3T_00080 [Terriglobia bacterium]